MAKPANGVGSKDGRSDGKVSSRWVSENESESEIYLVRIIIYSKREELVGSISYPDKN